jgi:hypothetical protein
VEVHKFLYFFVVVSLLGAVEYGTIRGRVVDAENQEPIPNTRVTISEIERSVYTDDNGEYCIHYIPLGTYEIEVSVFDYVPLTLTDVSIVGIHIFDFSMRPSMLFGLGEIVTEASQPLIDPLDPLNATTITAGAIKNSPVTTIDELLRVQPGFVRSEMGLHVHGGRANEIAYYIDGIWVPAHINVSSLEIIKAYTSGFDVEYSNALAGLVNMVTKIGGRKNGGHIHYLTDDLSPLDRLNFGYNRYDMLLHGPLTRRFRYIVSGELTFADAFQEALYRIESPGNEYNIYGKLNYTLPHGKGRICLSGLRARQHYVLWSPYTEPGNNWKYAENDVMLRTKQWFGTLAFDYLLTDKTLAALTIGIAHQDSVYGNRDYAWEETHKTRWYEDYRLKAEHLIGSMKDDSLRLDILIDSMMLYHEIPAYQGREALRQSPFGVYVFYITGDFPKWAYYEHSNVQMRFKIMHVLSRALEVKLGADYTWHTFNYFYNGRPYTASAEWDYYYPYESTPTQAAAYAQANITGTFFAAQAGVRLDHYKSLSIPDEPWEWPYPALTNTLKQSSTSVSPRIGITLPVLSRLKLWFNYGHYYQPQKAVLPEQIQSVVSNFGVEAEPLPDLFLSTSMCLKKSSNLIQHRLIILESWNWAEARYEDVFSDEISAHGLACAIRRRFLHGVSIELSYDLQYAHSPDYSDWYQDHYQYDSSSVYNAARDYDQRHTIHAHITVPFFEQSHDAPGFASFVVSYCAGHPYTLRDRAGNTIAPPNSDRINGYWNADLKISRAFRINKSRLVFTGIVNNLFNAEQVVDVYTTTGMPDDHGHPDPSPGQFANIPFTSSHYSPQADHNHDGLITPSEGLAEYIAARDNLYEDPTNYNNPFRLRLGIGLEF